MAKTRCLLYAVLLAAAIWTAGCAPAAAPTPAIGPPAGTLGGGSKQTADYSILLLGTPNPLARGGATLEAVVTDAKGQPVDDARVTFDLDMTNMSHGKNVVAAAFKGAGRYTGVVNFMMGGPWRVIVGVERAGLPAQTVRFDFSVNAR